MNFHKSAENNTLSDLGSSGEAATVPRGYRAWEVAVADKRLIVKRYRRPIKNKQGYDPSPPSCANCKNYKGPVMGLPPAKRYSPPICLLGDFAVKERAICDRWTGIDGSILE